MEEEECVVEREREREREVWGGSLEEVSMLLRGASFSSTICSRFRELEASFVSNASHMLRGARHQQQGLHHLFQTTAQCDPPHWLTTNHTMFDDVVNPLLERFLPSGSEQKSQPTLLIVRFCRRATKKRVVGRDRGGGERRWTGPGGWSRPLLPFQENRKIEGRQGHANKAMLLHFNQLLPSHMAAKHPEGRRRHES